MQEREKDDSELFIPWYIHNFLKIIYFVMDHAFGA